VLLALAFGAVVAYLASLNTDRVRVTLGADWSWDLPLPALVVGAFLLGAGLALFLEIVRDLGRTYREHQRVRSARRVESLAELYHRGLDAQLSGRSEAATEAYGRVLRREPDHAQAHARLGDMVRVALASALGRVYFELAMLDEAAYQFQKVEVRTPDLPGLHAYLGAIFERRGQTAEAFEEYRRALTLSGAFDWPHRCTACGAEHGRWMDRCPSCRSWNTSHP